MHLWVRAIWKYFLSFASVRVCIAHVGGVLMVFEVREVTDTSTRKQRGPVARGKVRYKSACLRVISGEGRKVGSIIAIAPAAVAIEWRHLTIALWRCVKVELQLMRHSPEIEW